MAKAVDQSPVSIVITDINGNIEYVNKYFIEKTGYSYEEALGKNPRILKSGYHDPKFYKDLWDTISQGGIWSGTMKNSSRDGGILWESVSISPIFNEEKTIINYVAVKENITDKRLTQEALARSEKKYRDLFTLSTDASLILKGDTFVDCNNAALKLLGMDDKKELIGLSPVDISPEFQSDGVRSEVKSLENISNAMKKKQGRFEWLHQNKQGGLLPIEVVLTKIDEEANSHLFVVWRDISERKKYETELKAALEEKEILLSEVHHRVKNNLAIISGLMQLQIYKDENNESAKVLAKSISRINSIALIHEQLYQSDRFSNISLKENIEKQIHNQMNMFDSAQLSKIKVEFEMEEVFININQALPVGLLMNEIITNALKYAFIGRKKGKITICLSEKKDEVYLDVRDDGVGLKRQDEPEDSSSLGLTLIDTFVEQLDGTCEVDTSSGTAYHITFKKQNIRGSMASKSFIN
jgi:PAS domain S-box-containing protein